jgi:hypothetical protein
MHILNIPLYIGLGELGVLKLLSSSLLQMDQTIKLKFGAGLE